MPLESVYPINLGMFFSSETVISTLESRILGGVGIIEGVDIVIIINNRGDGVLDGFEKIVETVS